MAYDAIPHIHARARKVIASYRADFAAAVAFGHTVCAILPWCVHHIGCTVCTRLARCMAYIGCAIASPLQWAGLESPTGTDLAPARQTGPSVAGEQAEPNAEQVAEDTAGPPASEPTERTDGKTGRIASQGARPTATQSEPSASDRPEPAAGKSGLPASENAGQATSRAATPTSPGPRGDAGPASRLAWAALLAAGVLGGGVWQWTDSVANMLAGTSQQIAEDLWEVSASVLHTSRPWVYPPPPLLPVSQESGASGEWTTPVEGDVVFSLLRLLLALAVATGVSFPLLLSLSRGVVESVLGQLPHAQADTHGPELVLHVRLHEIWGAPIVRVYEGGVLADACQSTLLSAAQVACCSDPLTHAFPRLCVGGLFPCQSAGDSSNSLRVLLWPRCNL